MLKTRSKQAQILCREAILKIHQANCPIGRYQRKFRKLHQQFAKHFKMICSCSNTAFSFSWLLQFNQKHLRLHIMLKEEFFQLIFNTLAWA